MKIETAEMIYATVSWLAIYAPYKGRKQNNWQKIFFFTWKYRAVLQTHHLWLSLKAESPFTVLGVIPPELLL